MKRLMTIWLAVTAVTVMGSEVMADTFGTGDNQFTIDFVTISGATNPTSGYGIVNYDYRMGTYEITNSQWGVFEAETGLNFRGSYSTGAEIPVNQKSWYAAVQFVNWLNTSKGYQAAYNFDGGTFSVWDVSDAWGGTNLYRHKDAYYFLPTEDEWGKAAYWNGTNLQTYATKAGESLHQGDGVSGTGWNYYNNGYATSYDGPWAVGSGSEELNGTFDMMGNVFEWMESPYNSGVYSPGSLRGLRGGSYNYHDSHLASSLRYFNYSPTFEHRVVGFRVASVPEPASLTLLFLGGLALGHRRRRTH